MTTGPRPNELRWRDLIRSNRTVASSSRCEAIDERIGVGSAGSDGGSCVRGGDALSSCVFQMNFGRGSVIASFSLRRLDW